MFRDMTDGYLVFFSRRKLKRQRRLCGTFRKQQIPREALTWLGSWKTAAAKSITQILGDREISMGFLAGQHAAVLNWLALHHAKTPRALSTNQILGNRVF